MLKWGSYPTHRGKLQIKKRKGVRTQVILVPDSNDESLLLNVTVDYAQVVKTRVDLSGKVGAITATSVHLLEVGDASEDPLLEVIIDGPVDAATEVIIPTVPATQKRWKKANDSVSHA